MATEKDMNELNAPLQSDYKEVVHDIAEELLARLTLKRMALLSICSKQDL